MENPSNHLTINRSPTVNKTAEKQQIYTTMKQLDWLITRTESYHKLTKS